MKIKDSESDNASLHRQLDHWQEISVHWKKERDTLAEQMKIEIEVLTKERDEQRQASDYWMTEACRDHNALQKLTEERDIVVRKLKALSDLNALENLYQAGLGQEYEITKLTKERDALKEDHTKVKAAAKLALDVLDEALKYVYDDGNYLPSVSQAITALRQAGVQ